MDFKTQDLIFFECDIQKFFEKTIHKFPTVVHNSKRMAQISKVAKIPMLSTVQVPRVFGDTHPDIKKEHDASMIKYFDKTLFSMLDHRGKPWF
jgi:hypothetical protein